MAPNITKGEIILPDKDESLEKLITPQASPRKYKIVYRNIIVFLYYHLAGLYGLHLCFTRAKFLTIFFGYITFWIAGLGITAGCHRLWAHKSYKATKPLQLLLMLCQSVSNQNSVIHWVRDHRLHHKYSDTDADPHNATRGFFYSHVGWLLVRKHPDVVKSGKLIDLSDVYGNPILSFQNKNSYWFIPLLSFVLPTLIPVYCWGETVSNAWHLNMLRYILNLNFTFCVNSVAHMWGYKPYDKRISPSQSHPVSILTLGEGYHNFHHVFPWDYRSDELSNMRINPTTIFIDICTWLGLAYDRRRAQADMVKARALRTGDGSWYLNSGNMTPNVAKKEMILPDEEESLEELIIPQQAKPRKYQIIVMNIIVLLYFHLAGLYGLYLCFTRVKFLTLFFGCVTYITSSLGVTAGAHRLWSHKSYKATKPLQLVLMLWQSIASQFSVIHWVRDHRVHHKFSDTDADPHNATRGFFFSHIGWLMVKKHPDVVKSGNLIDFSDVYGNPILYFQYKNSYWLIPLLSFVLPTLIPVYFWGETLSIAWHLNMLRYILTLHFTFFVNSFAHMWGYKPYDKRISPSQNHLLSILTLGDGFHNFHHVFPWDYRSDELSSLRFNPTTIFIDICAWLGLAYDLKTAPDDIVKDRSLRTGDGSWYMYSGKDYK